MPSLYEVPYRSPHGLLVRRTYNPLSLGDATTTAAAACPTRSLWWLVLAFGVGAAGAYQYAKKPRRARRA